MSGELVVAAPNTAVSTAVAAAQVPVAVGQSGSAAVATRAAAPTAVDLPELGGGLVIGDDDRPAFTSFWQALKCHGERVYRDAAHWYQGWEEQEAAREELWDAADAAETGEALSKEWGPLYWGNLAAIDTMLDGLPPGVDHALLHARLPGGMRLINSQVGARFLLSLARGAPAAQAGPALDAEKAEIEKLMGNHSSKYWRGSESARLQARYREILSGTAKPLAGNQLLEREMAELRTLSGRDGSAYWRGPTAEANQARMRELIRILGIT